MSNDRIGACPFCKFEYVITDEILGIVVRCPNPECAKQFTAGAAEAASAPPPETSTPPAETPPPETKTPPAETPPETKTPPAETKTPPAETAGSKLRPMKEDDFQTVHPDELMVHISRSPILRTFTLSLCGHVALIVLLSIGNFVMCVKYKKWSVTGAVASHSKALKDEKDAEKKAERAKAQAEQRAKRDAQAKIDAEKNPKKDADAAEKPAREKSAVEKELEETSSERPTESTMTLDDVDDGL
jgi:flagellar biosynthesis GTPase FlhF